jgi:hypothetical protein
MYHWQNLLGLNLKFCLASNNLQNNINKIILRIAHSIQTTFYLKQNNLNHNSQYEKQIYLKNNSWNPPPAPPHIEDKFSSFEKSPREKHTILVNKNKQGGLLNLTPLRNHGHKQLHPTSSTRVSPNKRLPTVNAK